MAESQSGCITVRDVPSAKFIAEYAKNLKLNQNFIVPKWVDLAKTGVHKELAPYDPDWYYIRAAAVARKIYLRQGTGVGALRKRFGGAYRRGARPEVHQDASGGIIRSIVKNLDQIKVTEATGKGGRKVTSVGQSALDLIAREIATTESP
jgi:small subunit ribosomal protein S19e